MMILKKEKKQFLLKSPAEKYICWPISLIKLQFFDAQMTYTPAKLHKQGIAYILAFIC